MGWGSRGGDVIHEQCDRCLCYFGLSMLKRTPFRTTSLNASSQTQSNLRNADGTNLNIDFTGLTGSLDVAWTW